MSHLWGAVQHRHRNSVLDGERRCFARGTRSLKRRITPIEPRLARYRWASIRPTADLPVVGRLS